MLTAVIPVSPFRDDSERIAKWALSQDLSGVSLVFIFDKCTPSSKFKKMLSECKADSVTAESGNFGGPGAARNHGLNLVKTDWVCFWDSDDLPNIANARLAVSKLISEDSDIGICEFETAFSTSADKFSQPEYQAHRSTDLVEIVLKPGIWRFIFRAKILDEISFPHTAMGEDQVFLARVLKEKFQLSWLNIPTYRYLRHDDLQLTKLPSAVDTLIASTRILFDELDTYDRGQFRFALFLITKQCVTVIKNSTIRLKLGAIHLVGKVFLISPLLTVNAFYRILIPGKFQKPAETHVVLNGGLGNQLFELSAGLKIAGNNLLFLEREIGYPRSQSSGKTALESFTFPARIQFSKKARWRIFSRACNFLLRNGLASADNFSAKIMTLVARVMATIYLRKPTNIFVNKGVGWSKFRSTQGRSILLIGYFQSYKNQSNETLSLFRETLSKVSGDELNYFRELAEKECPLVVHVRLSDYLSEINFGIPGIEYYFKAIRDIYDPKTHKKIWLFSDDIANAMRRIPEEFRDITRYIGEIDGNDHSSLVAMALGHDFVIANSTFSWWAARLSLNKKGRIIFPSPWFKGMSEPEDLFPPNWEPYPASFDVP